MRTGLFVGSFDPFTIGHDSIVRRALGLFDRLVIGVGVNDRKHYTQPAEARVKAIKDLYAGEPRVMVTEYDDLVVDLARRVGAQYIVKGLRNMRDFEYERDQADFNRQLGGIETVFFLTLPELQSVSSTGLRELEHFKKPIDKYIPHKEEDHD